ncbi:Protein of unknown function [Microlunatus flavus]|uniref:DUF3071 domain-containing protein n=2 Tax=Microlunatus flavus TaxID=1036181 RepID=A0A1H9IVL6_9ACTN|nr:Protein of unknown function [Microlunatus flavus]
MDTTLSPRDIQARIRGGESLDDLVAGSGMDADRVERFAAPVLAEREHVALTALGASIRRRGESSGHRPLRTVVGERLLGQGVDVDDVVWDAWKREDGQWQVSADYELLEQERHAEFRYDPQGRFSMAEDDDARWLAGERPSPVAAVIDRDDELALVRATSGPGDDEDAGRDGRTSDRADHEVTEQLEVSEDLVAVLSVVPPVELSAEELDELVAHDPESDLAAVAQDATRASTQDDVPDETRDGPQDEVAAHRRDEGAEPTVAVVRHLTSVSVEVEVDAEGDRSGEDGDPGPRSALDTLYDMLGGDGYAEEGTRIGSGLSDAAAVPVVDEHEFEPPATVQVPAEPGPDASEQEDGSQDAGGSSAEADQPEERDERTEPTQVVARDLRRTSAPAAPAVPQQDDLLDVDADADAVTDPGETTHHDAADAPPVPDVDEPLIPSPGASRKPGRRKRASVPSWDEIMFGGPKPG